MARPPFLRLPGAAVLLLALLLPSPLAAQADRPPGLGQVEFPATGAAQAMPKFLEGVLWLHSFEYAQAATAFREAQRLDPGFVMVYWGEAMSFNHPVWDEQDLEAARAVLARLGATPEARAARAATPRERAWLRTVEVLYGEGTKPARDTAYAAAMADLARDYPDDLEAQAFHALALLGRSRTVRDVPTYMRAGAIALRVLARAPGHPGAAHYVIHAFDDPVHAPLGLDAARSYSQIAPDAAHAQHMTTHIFLALGMWDDVVSQNEIASALTGWRSGHYVSWYHYGLLQQGRHQLAAETLDRALRDWADRPAPMIRAYLVSMRAHQVLLTGRWDDPVLARAIPLDGVDHTARAIDEFLHGYAALQQGRPDAAAPRLDVLREVAREAEAKGTTPNAKAVPGILARQLEGVLALHRGDADRGLVLLRDAAERESALPVEFGPPDVVKPSWELLGEVLLERGDRAGAERAFVRALELGPGRVPSVRGLVAATQAGTGAP